MPSGIIKSGLTLLALLLTACHSPTKEPRPVPATPQEMQAWAGKVCSGRTENNCHYFAEMQYGIQRNFYNAHRYHGRTCTVTVTWRQNGRYSVQSTQGDEQLCLKAWGVIGSAENLPPPPPSLPASMVIELKPD